MYNCTNFKTLKISQEKILDTVRVLFNAQGLASVTVRVICDELQISPGNFSYYFPDKRRLVVALYETMQEEMALNLQHFAHDYVGIGAMLHTFRAFSYVQLKYKFFFLNLFEILHSYPTIRRQYRKALIQERELTEQLFSQYQAQGVMKQDTPRDALRSVMKQCQILFAYWVVDAELSGLKSDKKKVDYYTAICFGPLLPYLTPKATKELQESIKHHPS